MKKILMIVQNDFINDSRIIKEASTLGKNDYKVKILALHNEDLPLTEKWDFFDVERVHLFTRKLSKNKFVQLSKYAEFFIKCLHIGKVYRPDIIHCHDIDTLPIGITLRKMLNNRPKTIYDSHELWSHVSSTITNPKIINWVDRKLEHKYIKQVDAVITVCDSIADYLRQQDDLDRKPIVLRNMPLYHKVDGKSDTIRKQLGLSPNQKIVLYQGGISRGRGLENVMRAAKYFYQDIVFVLLGNGSLISELKRLSEAVQTNDRVFFLPAVPYDELMDYTSSADLGIHPMMNTCLNHYFALPNKPFEYIQAEILIICSNFPEMSNIVKTYRVGETFNPASPEEIARVVNSLLEDEERYSEYKTNCRVAKKELNWEIEEQKLLQLYRELCDS